MHLSPAEYVILVFKGVRAAARAIGRSPASVSKWKQPRGKRGCGGNVPSAAQRKILEIADARGLDVTPNDLIYGRKVAKRSLKMIVMVLVFAVATFFSL